MWVFKYVARYIACLVKHHIWIGSHIQYCLRCGKLETGLEAVVTE
jgi:hypothetical protein